MQVCKVTLECTSLLHVFRWYINDEGPNPCTSMVLHFRFIINCFIVLVHRVLFRLPSIWNIWNRFHFCHQVNCCGHHLHYYVTGTQISWRSPTLNAAMHESKDLVNLKWSCSTAVRRLQRLAKDTKFLPHTCTTIAILRLNTPIQCAGHKGQAETSNYMYSRKSHVQCSECTCIALCTYTSTKERTKDSLCVKHWSTPKMPTAHAQRVWKQTGRHLIVIIISAQLRRDVWMWNFNSFIIPVKE